MMLKQIFDRIAREQGVSQENLEARLDDFIAEKLVKSPNLQIAFNVTQQEMHDLYSEAWSLYMKEDFEAAYPLFKWLTAFNPFDEKHWMGTGACLQMLKRYENALQAYAMAAICDKKDPLPHFHAYECYSALSNSCEAAKALDDARIRAASHPLYSGLRQEIDQLRGGKLYA